MSGGGGGSVQCFLASDWRVEGFGGSETLEAEGFGG